MERTKTVKNPVNKCNLPTNADLEKMSVDERIELGKKNISECKKRTLLKSKLAQTVREKELPRERKANIHKNIRP